MNQITLKPQLQKDAKNSNTKANKKKNCGATVKHIALYNLNHKSKSSKAGVRNVSECFATLQASVSSAVSLTHRTTALPGGLHANNIKPTLANKQNKELCEISNTKMQIAMSKQGRLLIFGREGTVETETVLGEICARLPSVHQRVRGKSSHSGRTWRREWMEEETLLLPDGVKHPSESTC